MTWYLPCLGRVQFKPNLMIKTFINRTLSIKEKVCKIIPEDLVPSPLIQWAKVYQVNRS